MIECMYGGKTPAEMVALVIDAPDKKSYDIVRKYWLAQMGGKDARKSAGARRLNDGVVAAAKPAEACQSFRSTPRNWPRRWLPSPKRFNTGIEVAFVPSSSAWDGRFANNGWMQEAPDPIIKADLGQRGADQSRDRPRRRT